MGQANWDDDGTSYVEVTSRTHWIVFGVFQNCTLACFEILYKTYIELENKVRGVEGKNVRSLFFFGKEYAFVSPGHKNVTELLNSTIVSFY